MSTGVKFASQLSALLDAVFLQQACGLSYVTQRNTEIKTES